MNRKYSLVVLFLVILAVVALPAWSEIVKKDWTTGETITETDLDQFGVNDEILEAEAGYKYLSVTECTLYGFVDSNTDLKIQFLIDGAVTTGFDEHSGAGDYSANDIYISNLTVALHTITARITSDDIVEDFVFRFYKTADMDRMSYWLKLDRVSFGFTNGDDEVFRAARISGVTIIGHRVAENFS